MCKGKTDNVICQICNTEISFGRIKRHIKVNHKEILIEDYIQKYYQTLPLHQPCVICNKNIVYKYQTCSKECHGKLTSLKLKGQLKPENFMDENHKNKLSVKQKENWKEGKTIGFTGYTHTEEVKQIQRETIRKIKPHKGFPQTDYQKQQARNSINKRIKEGWKPYTLTNPHTPEIIEKIIKNGRKYMNKLEEKVSKILEENNIKYTYNFFLNNKVICKQYDFKIGNILLEIDGDYWHGGPGVKTHHFSASQTQQNDLLKNQLAEELGYKLVRVWESEFKLNPNTILERIK